MSNFWTLYTRDMAHRHVLIGYVFTWLIQLVYLAFVVVRSFGKRTRA